MRYNIRRLSKLVLRGNIGQVIFPTGIEEENNLQKLHKLVENKLSSALKETLNSTFQELAETAKDSPKQFVKNVVCFGPNLFSLLRSKQRPGYRRRSMRSIRNLLKTPGELLLYDNTILTKGVGDFVILRQPIFQLFIFISIQGKENMNIKEWIDQSPKGYIGPRTVSKMLYMSQQLYL